MRLLKADDVTLERVRRVLASAGIEGEILGESVVVELAELKILITIQRPHLHLLALFGCRKGSGTARLNEAMNHLNGEYIYVRAALLKGGRQLVADHFLFIGGGGIPETNVASCVRRFAAIVRPAIADHLSDFAA